MHMSNQPDQKGLVAVEHKREKKVDTRLEELQDLEQKIKDAKAVVDEFIPLLDKSCSRYVDILNELLNEKENESREPKGFQKGKPKRKKSKTSKQMYNKIAGECHPDKTDDEEMHEKFIQAKEMLENGDDYGLYDIYKEFSDELEVDDCLDVGVELVSKTIELNQIIQSSGYKICIIYKSGEVKKAKTLYLDLVMTKIKQLEQEFM